MHRRLRYLRARPRGFILTTTVVGGFLVRVALGLPFGTVRCIFGLVPLFGFPFQLISMRVIAQIPRVLAFAGRERWLLVV